MNFAIAWLAFSMELRLLSRERSTRLLLGALTALFLYSVSNGAFLWTRVVEDGVAAQGRALRSLEAWGEEVRTGKFVTSGARGSKADSPYFASAQRLPFAIRPSPLLMLETSSLSSRSWVDELSAWSSEQDLFRHDDLANPLLLQSGSVDVNLLTSFVLPLALCALAMRGQAEDRSNEVHRWMRALSGEGVSIQCGKLGGGLCLGLAPVCVAITAVVIYAVASGTSHGDWLYAALGWLILVSCYSALWLLLFSWVARRWPAPSGYLSHSVALWMVFAVFLPAARGLLLDRFAPAPDPAAMTVFRQGLDTRMSQLRSTAEATVRERHPEWFGPTSGDRREVAILSSFLVAQQEQQRAFAPYLAKLSDREQLSRRLAWMSPCLWLADGLRSLSGDGEYDLARRRAYGTLARLQQTLFPMILRGEKLSAAYYVREAGLLSASVRSQAN